MALVVEDEVGVEVSRQDWGAPVPGVAAIGILQFLLGLMDHLLIAPHADLVAVQSISSSLLVFIGSGVSVVKDNEDLALLHCT